MGCHRRERMAHRIRDPDDATVQHIRSLQTEPAKRLSSASSRSTSHGDHGSPHWLPVSWHSLQVRG